MENEKMFLEFSTQIRKTNETTYTKVWEEEDRLFNVKLTLAVLKNFPLSCGELVITLMILRRLISIMGKLIRVSRSWCFPEYWCCRAIGERNWC